MCPHQHGCWVASTCVTLQHQDRLTAYFRERKYSVLPANLEQASTNRMYKWLSSLFARCSLATLVL